MDFVIKDEETNHRFLMSSPWPICAIVATYLLFVKFGPIFMKNRKAFELRSLLLLYNVYQMLINACLFILPFTIDGFMTYIWRHGCHPVDSATNPFWIQYRFLQWLFFLSRLVDLLDTVFFVLNKKETHISFLHVFHHAEAVLFAFLFTKYMEGEQAVVFGFLNTFVHTIMYGYFMIAALGPRYRKYLWWKSHVTKLQLLQFFIMGVHALGLIIADCSVSHMVSLFILLQSIIFSWLFGRFYWKTYIFPHRQEEQVKHISAAQSSEKVKVK